MKLIVLGLCGVIAVLVFLTMVITIALHRMRNPCAAGTTTLAECLWAIIPCLILTGAALPAVSLVMTGD